jgi:glycerol-1-phosphate dehydrogenase [NAD(P)+]
MPQKSRQQIMTKPIGNLRLSELAGTTFACPCGVTHTIAVREILLQHDALTQIANVARRHLPGNNGLLIADDITYPLAGNRVQEYLADAGYHLEVIRLPDRPDGHVVADDQTVAFVARHVIPATDFLVAVGAGTVNDVTKLASFQTHRPYLVCPTAPSMNGFTSTVAAILSQGVKRTIAAHLPVAVVADVAVLSTAPAAMRRAGLGDLLSKPVSNADWLLAHMIKSDYYCDLPLRLVEEAERACRQHAAAIGQGTFAGTQALSEALLRSGCSMAIAGSSSPASGGEHLLSHYWDMTAHWHGRQENLHGAQVGVATLVTATLYEKLRQVDPSQIDLQALRRHYPTWDQLMASMRQVHGPLAAALIPEAAKKYMPLAQKEAEWRYILAHWPAIWQRLDAILSPAADLRDVLLAAGAPTTVRELGIGEDELRTAFLHARDMRGRYTVLDFAHDLGLLTLLCDAVLQDSRVLD